MSEPAMAWQANARLLLPLVAVFVVAAGYGVVLPVLPFVLERLLDGAGRETIAQHTGGLTGVYMLALFLFAPVWGYFSDRVGRRAAMLLGLAGFGVSMVLFGFARDLAFAYALRALAGLSAAAVLPVALAAVADQGGSEQRARGFAWLSAASALGFLLGPALSGWLAEAQLMLPFYAVAAMGGAVWLAVWLAPADVRWQRRSADAGMPSAGAPSLAGLLFLSLLVMYGLGSFEVAIALQGQQMLGLGPREVGFMFVECSLVMILVQIFIFMPLFRRVGGSLLVGAFLTMAAGSALLPYAPNYYVLLLGVGLISASSGILIPALAYLTSLAAGTRQGATLGAQTAIANLGQAAGSAAAGWLFGTATGAPFWVAAGLLGLGAAAALHSRCLEKVPRDA